MQLSISAVCAEFNASRPIGAYGDLWGVWWPMGGLVAYGGLWWPMGTDGGIWGTMVAYGDLWGLFRHVFLLYVGEIL